MAIRTSPGFDPSRARAIIEARQRREGPGGGHGVLAPEGAEDVDVRSLRQRLQREVGGEVLFDAGNRGAYSHDSSNYRQPPIGVVLPLDPDDIEALHDRYQNVYGQR